MPERQNREKWPDIYDYIPSSFSPSISPLQNNKTCINCLWDYQYIEVSHSSSEAGVVLASSGGDRPLSHHVTHTQEVRVNRAGTATVCPALRSG